jgi:dihydropteroate synthase
VVAVNELGETVDLSTFLEPRQAIAGLDLLRPHVMGILNVTPDSFSDGGRHNALPDAVAAALPMQEAGASLIDIGGESTRPGAEFVEPSEEIDRTAPVIRAIGDASTVPVSIDTRKSKVAAAALSAGASLVNDVAGFTFDDHLAPLCAARGVPVCVMHAQGDPKTMQDNPQYEDVVLDVYDFLAARIAYLEKQGIEKARIIVDPGIGFGKTADHNLALLRNISIFHGLGCAILVGASRKRFIGTIGKEPQANARGPGSIAVGLASLAQGVQFLRVHDVPETVQAMRLWDVV